MASRTSRKSASRTPHRSHSPQVSTSSFRERSRSPLSPTRLSRIQEKEELQNLNDRLATYIDTVRRLESENNRLNVLVKTTQETVTREVTSIKNVYEKELSEVRKALDETARDKAKLQLAADKWKHEMEELAIKLAKKEKELITVEKQLKSSEFHNQDLQRRVNQLLSENKKLESQLKEAQADRDKYSQQLSAVKRDLDGETLLRVDLENRLQSMKEELQFKESIHQQEIRETRHMKETEVSELDTQIRENYEQRLADSLRDLREQYESQMRINRDEIETIYESKIADLQNRCDRASSSSVNQRDEVRTLKTRCETFASKNSALENQLIGLQSRIRDLEKMLEQERDWHNDALQAKDEEYRLLREDMDRQLTEYQDLLDIKTALDLEIAAYRKLLEGEETRLNLSPVSSRAGSPQPSGSTPLRATKRRRLVTTDTEKSSMGTQITKRAKGSVEICDHDSKGKFVKLHNKGNSDVPLGGWQIVQLANQQEVKFKFPRGSIIKPDAYITVWSCDSGVAHNPPLHYLMKTRWSSSTSLITYLLNGSGEEVAARESLRVSESSEVQHIQEE